MGRKWLVEEAGFQLLEKAIETGKEFDKICRILEGMENNEVSDDEKERKKKKPKKPRMKTSLFTVKGMSN